jgi:Fic family protein
MVEYVERFWHPEDAGGLGRKDRKPGRYLAYVPAELGEDLPSLGTAAADAAEDALAVLARADERIGDKGRYLNHLLIRSESISSSWIEGNRVTPKALAIAELLQQGSKTALDVVANVRATESAIAALSDRNRPVGASDIEDLQHVIEPRLPRGLRQEQNWVGGTGWSPLRADFVPPPETEVARLVDDLARFTTATTGNPVVRAAIAHAQFETIHPFIDGNGRTGRALIHTVLRRGDAVRNTLIPISTVFAGSADTYIRGLTAFRAQPSRLDEWVASFAHAAEIAAGRAAQFAVDIAALDERLQQEFTDYRREQGLSPAVPRRDATTVRILDSLATHPVLTVESVSTLVQVSTAAAHRALTELAAANILGRRKDQNGRLICWTADRHLDLTTFAERSNRVGGVDTRIRQPRRGPAAPHPDEPDVAPDAGRPRRIDRAEIHHSPPEPGPSSPTQA